MSEKIEPALTAEEWATLHVVRDHVDSGGWPEPFEAECGAEGMRIGPREFGPSMFVRREDFAALIALANHALPDDNPGKITRLSVVLVREMLKQCLSHMAENPNYTLLGREANKLADALESYLPPVASSAKSL